MRTSKHLDHTIEEINNYLDRIKKSIMSNKFIVCQTDKNEKNREFIIKYKLDFRKQKEMLMELESTDFCYSVDNYKNPSERMYIFCREYELNNWGNIEKVDVYIKTVIKQNDSTVVVSFHKREKNVKKLFM